MNDQFDQKWNRTGREHAAPTPGARGWTASPSSDAGVSHLRLVWKFKILLLISLLLGALAGTGYVVLRTPRYEATTTVELVGFNQAFMNMNQVDPQAGTDPTTASVSNIQTQMRILTSRSILNRVLERMNLEMTPLISPPGTFFTKLRAKLPWVRPEPLEQSKEALEMAWVTASARGVGATRLIEIHCQSTSPEVAATFVNTLASEHISQGLASRSQLTQRTSQWMESQLEEAKARLEQAGSRLREFVKQSGMDFFPEQATLADSKLRQLQTDVAGIQADRIAKQARWEMARNVPLARLADVTNDVNLQGLKGRIVDLRREMAQLTATLTPEHYKVQRIQAQITELEQTLQREEVAILKRLESDYQEALRRERLLSGAYSVQTRSVGAQADKASQYSMLKRDVEMAQQVYSNLLQQSNQAALVALVPAGNIRVVDPAAPASAPASPQPSRDIPLAAFLGGGLGYALIWMQETRRRKQWSGLVTGPGVTRTMLGVPELGVIPSAIVTPTKRLLPPIPKRRSILAETNDQSQEVEIATLKDRSSLMAESFRQTLASILRNRPAAHNPIYVVTSVGPGEGKTTLTANLAIAMADIGQKVLMIDADLRRARLHKLFGLPQSKGFTDLLTFTRPPSEDELEDYLLPTKVANLKIMTLGLAEVETPALLSFSPVIRQIGASLRKRFDTILVDTGPVLLFPDARLLGKHSDGVLLVVRAGVTSQEGAVTTCQRLAEDGVPVLGTILNDWVDHDSSEHGAYSRYYGAYRKLS